MKLKNIFGKTICVDGISMKKDEILEFSDTMKSDQGIKNLIKNKYIEIVKPTKKK